MEPTPAETGRLGYQPLEAAKDLHLRIFQPGPVESALGASRDRLEIVVVGSGERPDSLRFALAAGWAIIDARAKNRRGLRTMARIELLCAVVLLTASGSA